jgi:hypothetical protein
MQLEHTLAFLIQWILANRFGALRKSEFVDFFTIKGTAEDPSGLRIGIWD